MAAAASKPPATAHHTSVSPLSGAPCAYRVANTDPRSHNRVNACPVAVEAAQLGIELNMSLEIIGTLASVATLVVVLYIQVKPAVNRWATVRYLLLCSELDEVVLSQTTRIRRVRMGVQLLLYQGLMTRADRRNGQNLFSQFTASAPTGCHPVVAIAVDASKKKKRRLHKRRRMRKHRGLRCSGECGTRFGKRRHDHSFIGGGGIEGWRCPSTNSCEDRPTGNHYCGMCEQEALGTLRRPTPPGAAESERLTDSESGNVDPTDQRVESARIQRTVSLSGRRGLAATLAACAFLYLPFLLPLLGVRLPARVTLALWSMSLLSGLGGIAVCWSVALRTRRRGGAEWIAAEIGRALGISWLLAVGLLVAVFLFDAGQLVQMGEALEHTLLHPLGKAAGRGVAPGLALAAAATTAGLVGLSVSRPPSGESEATGRDHWERRNDVFEATIQAAVAVFILSTAVAVISPTAVAWRGALGGPLLLLLAAVPTFLVFTVKALREAVGTNEPPEQH